MQYNIDISVADATAAEKTERKRAAIEKKENGNIIKGGARVQRGRRARRRTCVFPTGGWQTGGRRTRYRTLLPDGGVRPSEFGPRGARPPPPPRAYSAYTASVTHVLRTSAPCCRRSESSSATRTHTARVRPCVHTRRAAPVAETRAFSSRSPTIRSANRRRTANQSRHRRGQRNRLILPIRDAGTSTFVDTCTRTLNVRPEDKTGAGSGEEVEENISGFADLAAFSPDFTVTKLYYVHTGLVAQLHDRTGRVQLSASSFFQSGACSPTLYVYDLLPLTCSTVLYILLSRSAKKKNKKITRPVVIYANYSFFTIFFFFFIYTVFCSRPELSCVFRAAANGRTFFKRRSSVRYTVTLWSS